MTRLTSSSQIFHLSVQIQVSVRGEEVLNEKMTVMRDIWEETSFRLERHQANPECVAEEESGLATRLAPPYKLTFDPNVHEGLADQTLTQGNLSFLSALQKSQPWLLVYRVSPKKTLPNSAPIF